jgi:hypothetical protein
VVPTAAPKRGVPALSLTAVAASNSVSSQRFEMSGERSLRTLPSQWMLVP